MSKHRSTPSFQSAPAHRSSSPSLSGDSSPVLTLADYVIKTAGAVLSQKEKTAVYRKGQADTLQRVQARRSTMLGLDEITARHEQMPYEEFSPKTYREEAMAYVEGQYSGFAKDDAQALAERGMAENSVLSNHRKLEANYFRESDSRAMAEAKDIDTGSYESIAELMVSANGPDPEESQAAWTGIWHIITSTPEAIRALALADGSPILREGDAEALRQNLYKYTYVQAMLVQAGSYSDEELAEAITKLEQGNFSAKFFGSSSSPEKKQVNSREVFPDIKEHDAELLRGFRSERSMRAEGTSRQQSLFKSELKAKQKAAIDLVSDLGDESVNAIQVARFIDGDTVDVFNETGELERVRLWDIEVHEIDSVEGAKGLDELISILTEQLDIPFGVSGLNQSAAARISRDDITIVYTGVDGNGRKLGELRVGGESVGKIMIESGSAVAYDRTNEALVALEGEATPGFSASQQRNSFPFMDPPGKVEGRGGINVVSGQASKEREDLILPDGNLYMGAYGDDHIKAKADDDAFREELVSAATNAHITNRVRMSTPSQVAALKHLIQQDTDLHSDVIAERVKFLEDAEKQKIKELTESPITYFMKMNSQWRAEAEAAEKDPSLLFHFLEKVNDAASNLLGGTQVPFNYPRFVKGLESMNSDDENIGIANLDEYWGSLPNAEALSIDAELAFEGGDIAFFMEEHLRDARRAFTAPMRKLIAEQWVVPGGIEKKKEIEGIAFNKARNFYVGDPDFAGKSMDRSLYQRALTRYAGFLSLTTGSDALSSVRRAHEMLSRDKVQIGQTNIPTAAIESMTLGQRNLYTNEESLRIMAATTLRDPAIRNNVVPLIGVPVIGPYLDNPENVKMHFVPGPDGETRITFFYPKGNAIPVIQRNEAGDEIGRVPLSFSLTEAFDRYHNMSSFFTPDTLTDEAPLQRGARTKRTEYSDLPAPSWAGFTPIPEADQKPQKVMDFSDIGASYEAMKQELRDAVGKNPFR